MKKTGSEGAKNDERKNDAQKLTQALLFNAYEMIPDYVEAERFHSAKKHQKNVRPLISESKTSK